MAEGTLLPGGFLSLQTDGCDILHIRLEPLQDRLHPNVQMLQTLHRNVLMYQKPALFGIPDGAIAIKLSFLSVAVWWAVFSIPIMLWVKEPKIHKPVGFGEAIGLGIKQIADTIKEVRHLKIVGIFLLAYWLYIDGVDTIVRMAVDYGMSIGFPSSSLIIALLMVQFIAFPATLVFNLFASRIGGKKAILFAIFAYG